MNAATYSDVVWDWLAHRYAPLKHAEKLLARDAMATPRTARAWLRREHAPYGEHLLTLMAQNDELAAVINNAVKDRRCALRLSSNSGGAALDTMTG
jgi:hypothetical protein